MQDPNYTIKNSACRLLAISVQSLFPKAQLVSGEVTDLGFYYDFFFPEPITEEQIPFIEERMRDFMRQDVPIKNLEMVRKNAIELFKYHRQDLKTVLLKGNVETLVHVCQIGQFYDLGYPPFVPSTKQIGVVKLLEIHPLKLSLPGRPNLALTRIRGTAFPDAKSLKNFLRASEEAKKRDHRQLGKKLQLFSLEEGFCPGCWFWLPKGAFLKETLMDAWKNEQQRQKVQLVFTPNLIQDPTRDGTTLQFEPQGVEYSISCTKAPMHAALFNSKLHSYRELPVRYGEISEMYDQGKEAHQWGLLRARSFTIDQVYIFCSQEQLLQELISSLQFIDKTVKIFAFEVHWNLVIKSPNSKESKSKWEESQAHLIKALKACGFSYSLDNEGKAPYGPVIEAHLKDALGRTWKGPSVYIDIYHRDKIGLRYQGADDQMHAPFMIGRSLFGSLERFIALLIETGQITENVNLEDYCRQLKLKMNENEKHDHI